MENEPLGTLYRSHNEPEIIPIDPDKNWIVIETDGTFQKIQDVDSGLFGLIRNGELLARTEWFEATRFLDCWYLRKDQESRRYWLKSGNYSRRTGGEHNQDKVQDDGSIVTYDATTGRYGFVNRTGLRILANEYDEVFKWDRCEVIFARKGNVGKYFDILGLQILSCVRDIPGATDYEYPYYEGEPQTNIIQTMDTTENPVGDDFCVCHGVRAGLSRRTTAEHVSFLQSLSNVRRLTRKAKRAFMKKSSYIYASFVVQSAPGAKHPVYDCLKQLFDREEFESSWEWILVVILPQAPTLEQKQEVDWLAKCLKESSDVIKMHKIAYGVHPTLKEGAIVCATRFFWDAGNYSRDWPTFEHLGMSEAKLFVKKNRISKFMLSKTLEYLINDCGGNDEMYSWHKKEGIANWLIQSGAIIQQDIFLEIGFYSAIERNTVDIIKWILNPKHARFKIDINIPFSDNTILDRVYLWESKSESVKSDLIDLLKRNGAKTFIELRTEESRKYGYEEPVFLQCKEP